MAAAGLRDDDEAIQLGVAQVRDWVAGGTRSLSQGQLVTTVAALDLSRGPSAATLAIQAIGDDQHPEEADVVLDWREFFVGASEEERHAASPPDAWTESMWPQLVSASEQFRSSDDSRVHVRAIMRLPGWFACGAALSRTRGFDLVARRRGIVYATFGPDEVKCHVETQWEEVGVGPDIAIIIEVSAEAGDEPRSALASAGVAVSHLARLRSGSGIGPNAISTPAEARCLAATLRDEIHELVRSLDPMTIHLFLVVPDFEALLLGHLWNRVRPVQLYEHLGIGRGYQKAFRIPG